MKSTWNRRSLDRTEDNLRDNSPDISLVAARLAELCEACETWGEARDRMSETVWVALEWWNRL